MLTTTTMMTTATAKNDDDDSNINDGNSNSDDYYGYHDDNDDDEEDEEDYDVYFSKLQFYPETVEVRANLMDSTKIPISLLTFFLSSCHLNIITS